LADSCEYKLEDIWPDDLYIVVQASGGLINPGGQVFTLPIQFAGWKIRINSSNSPVDYQDQGVGDPYFTIDYDTRVVTLWQDVVLLQKIVVMAYKPTLV
jgi:hypothetical protein